MAYDIGRPSGGSLAASFFTGFANTLAARLGQGRKEMREDEVTAEQRAYQDEVMAKQMSDQERRDAVQRAFISSEREGAQVYQSSENVLDRGQQTFTQATEHKFLKGQALGAFAHQTSEREKTQEFTTGRDETLQGYALAQQLADQVFQEYMVDKNQGNLVRNYYMELTDKRLDVESAEAFQMLFMERAKQYELGNAMALIAPNLEADLKRIEAQTKASKTLIEHERGGGVGGISGNDMKRIIGMKGLEQEFGMDPVAYQEFSLTKSMGATSQMRP